MRATLASAALARYAGRFVWLELDFDKPVNEAFIKGHGVTFTPTVLVLDPADERATAAKLGGLTLSEVGQFLERGEHGVKERASKPADAALARADEMMGSGRLTDAGAAYREALRLAGPDWPERNQGVASLTKALAMTRDSQGCAETAAAAAVTMPRGPAFATTVLNGYGCAGAGGATPWAEAARKTLEPLAIEALGVSTVSRDNHFQLLQQLMYGAMSRGDSTQVSRWGERWLSEIDAIAPADDDERSALDIARVDAARLMNEPARVIPALIASERAMPTNYNASMRLAEMAAEAERYDEALEACERALAHVTGPTARCWILETKANALVGKGDPAAARKVLEEALESARTIGNERTRDRQVRQLTRAIAETGNKL